jgi:hypothetical protein
MEKMRNDSGNNTDSWMNVIRAVFSTTPYWLMALGASTRIDICLEIDQVRTDAVHCSKSRQDKRSTHWGKSRQDKCNTHWVELKQYTVT